MADRIPHDSSTTHVAGRSEFIDDRPWQTGELAVGILGSPIAHGRLKKLDARAALQHPGVHGVFTAQDLVGRKWGPNVKDQPILVEDAIEFLGEALAVVAAETPEQVQAAKELVKVEVEEMEPIIDIETAYEKKHFLPGEGQRISKGDVASALAHAPHKIKGRFHCKAQDHFYLESQAAVVYPGEQGCMEVHSSTQHPTEVQHVVAEALGLSYHQVVCIVRRMGGAFGGKESQASPIAALAALVAQKTGRPARLCLTKDDDMQMTGKRHPFLNFYEAAFDDEGRILAIKAKLFSDAGAYFDLSNPILQRALLHLDNAYYLPAVELEGRLLKTNTAPNTAFRGFGGPQGVATIENIIEEIAQHLNKDALEIREINIYREGSNETHYGQQVENNTLPELFSTLAKKTNYHARRDEIRAFNRTSSQQLRGLALTPVKFGISFTNRILNQGNALVNLHKDATLQVSTGATEMGQGVNTKIQRVVAEAMGVTIDSVRLMPTSTEKNANTSATAASAGSDLNGSAALRACESIKRRLSFVARHIWSGKELRPDQELDFDGLDSSLVFEEGQIKDGSRSVPLRDAIDLAYRNRISLNDYGFYRTAGIHYDAKQGRGCPFLYYTTGVAASEVSLDRYTGEVKVLRADILMDLGRRIVEGIDFGQTSGAFIQGMGWVTTENVFFDESGRLVSHSPTTYKIPNVQDIPREFNVDFMETLTNTKNLRGSKAVGEPPFLLAISVWAAVKNALSYSDRRLQRLPATAEEVLLALS